MLQALVVDDNFYNRDLCKLALDAAGFETTEANDGTEALTKLFESVFHVLILDLQMPEISGIDVIETLIERSVHKDLCTIVLTANPHMATTEVEGYVDYLFCKPIDIQVLAQILSRIKNTLTN